MEWLKTIGSMVGEQLDRESERASQEEGSNARDCPSLSDTTKKG